MAIIPYRGSPTVYFGVHHKVISRNASLGANAFYFAKMVSIPQTPTRNHMALLSPIFLTRVSSSPWFSTGPHLYSKHNRGARFIVRADVDYYSALGVSRNASKSEMKSGKYTSESYL